MDREKQYQMLPAALLPWYRANARALPWRRDTEPYHVWLSEIMLQQTRVEAVRAYYLRFLEQLPTIAALAGADEQKLLKLWEGLGYYSRARNLQKAAKVIVEKHGGAFPQHFEEILALPGVGAYTAGALASICFEQPRAAVDGNVLRVISRITEDDTPIDLPQVKQEMAQKLERIYPQGNCGTFTQALMELGATVCTPKTPRCDACPCADFCLARQHGTQAQLPVRLPKREKKLENRTVYLFYCGDKLAICRRENSGLLAGLWQLPNEPGELDAAAALKHADDMGVQPIELCRELRRTHIFTHIRWEMVGYHIQCREENPAFTWASPAELESRYALPTAFRQFLPELNS